VKKAEADLIAAKKAAQETYIARNQEAEDMFLFYSLYGSWSPDIETKETILGFLCSRYL